jgi:hypothetical protein
MKKLCSSALFLFVATAGLSGALRYSLDYQICGSDASWLLFFFPLRVYYDASASINFAAFPQPDGETRFVFENIPRSAYVLRTLGFSAKTLALFTADMDEARARLFSDTLLSLWQREAPGYATRIKNIKEFPHLLIISDKNGLSFSRDGNGIYRDFVLNLKTIYRYYPARIGIYFNIFPMLGELLNLFNYPFTPGQNISQVSQFPAEWNGDWLDFSADFNRLVALIDKTAKSLVTVEQRFPFRLKFHISENGPDEVEICGEAFPDVPVWKSFMIREFFRRVRVRLADGALLLDEIWIGIRNNKSQGGFGRLQLKLIN